MLRALQVLSLTIAADLAQARREVMEKYAQCMKQGPATSWAPVKLISKCDPTVRSRVERAVRDCIARCALARAVWQSPSVVGVVLVVVRREAAAQMVLGSRAAASGRVWWAGSCGMPPEGAARRAKASWHCAQCALHQWRHKRFAACCLQPPSGRRV